MTAASISRDRPRPPAGVDLTAGSLLTLTLVVVGFLSILWTPYSSVGIDVGSALQDPSQAHWLGTDPLGRDVSSLLMKGVLTSFVVAGIAVIIGALIGVPLGMLAARWPRIGGFGDSVAGVAALFPPLIVAVILATNFGASAIVSMVAIGIGAIVPFARATSSALKAVSSKGYVDAARLAGFTRWEAVRHHLLRQIVRPIAAAAATLVGMGVIWEASLSYVGLGSQSPAASLGLMVHDAQPYISAKPLLLVIPGLILVLMIVALSLVARGIARQTDAEDADAAA